MKQISKLASIIIMVLFPLMALGQKRTHSHQESWENERIGFACGFGGMPTDAVHDAVKFIRKKEYESISQLLYSIKPYEQFLAVLLMDQFGQMNGITPNTKDALRIAEIRKSESEVAVCAGCTYFTGETLKDLLNLENKHMIYEDGEFWFESYYNQ